MWSRIGSLVKNDRPEPKHCLDVSIIITIKNREEMLSACLASIRRYFDGKIVVVDDASKNSVRAICNLHGASLIELPQAPGPIRKNLANNIGAASTDSKFLFFNDVDCLHPTPIILSLVKMYEKMGDYIYEPARLDVSKSASEILDAIRNGKVSDLPVANISSRAHKKLKDNTTEIHEDWTNCWGYGIFTTRAAFNAVGGFDVEMVGCGAGDVDFTYRLYKLGYRFVFTREIHMIHVNHMHMGYEQKDKNWEIFHEKHGFRKGKPCVISLGINTPAPHNHPRIIYQRFQDGLNNIRLDLQKNKFGGDLITWGKDYPAGSPLHEKSPAGFKPFCFLEAYQKGYRLIMWMDASIKIKKPIDELFDVIKKEGYLLFYESHSAGEYCSDEALEKLGITRTESFSLPSCWSCVLGLNLNNKTALQFLHTWKERALDGTFVGPKWAGRYGWPRISQDIRVHGHRYDQTAASVIAYKLGMRNWKQKSTFFEFFANNRLSVRKQQDKI